jgi:acyl transferase domain-containing protein
LLRVLGQLWLAGGEIDWQKFHANERRHRVALPTYPFERQRYWLAAYRPDKTSNDAEPAPAPADHSNSYPARIAFPDGFGDGADPQGDAALTVEQILEQQLYLMSQQLALLGQPEL